MNVPARRGCRSVSTGRCGKGCSAGRAGRSPKCSCAGPPDGPVRPHAGQDCCARSRILVERTAYDRFLSLLVEATRELYDPAIEQTYERQQAQEVLRFQLLAQ